jgi:hypothetical protein
LAGLLKSLILAILFTLAYTTVITALVRTGSIHSRAAMMTKAFLLSVPLFVWAHLATPGSLGFLPEVFIEPWYWTDLAFGLMLYGAGFFGGVLQLYNLADRGLSLRILIDIDESAGGTLDAHGVAERYSAGKGIGWMYQKRIDDMVETGLLSINGKNAVLTDRGRRLAMIFVMLRGFLRMEGEEGGAS